MKNCLYYVTLFSIICQSKEQSDCKILPPYPCCYNQYLYNNTCTECPYGSFGWNCKSFCPKGFYGQLCQSPCECVSSECHHMTGCTTSNDPQSGPKLATDATSHHNLLTIANVAGEVSTHQGIKPTGENLHIHHEDDQASPMSTLGFSLLGSLSSLFIIGSVLFIRSGKKRWKIRGSQSFSKIKYVLLPCVNQDRRQEVNQGSGDIELSNVNAPPVCGQDEDDSPYSEIRYSQFIGRASTGGACMNTASCTMHKYDSDRHHYTSEKQNVYQMSMNENEYDCVNLQVKSLELLSDRNLSLPHSNVEEYLSLSHTPSLGTCKEFRRKDDLKCQNLTLPKNTTTDFNERGKSESKPYRLLTEYSLQQLEFEMGVEIDQLSEKTKHQFVDTGRQTGPQGDNRPYSMAGGLSDNNLSEIVVESSNLQDINLSENKHLSVADLSEAVEDSENPLDIDIPGRRENTRRMEDNIQTNARPYSIAKILEF